jgi:hypothetical protein
MKYDHYYSPPSSYVPPHRQERDFQLLTPPESEPVQLYDLKAQLETAKNTKPQLTAL